MRNRVMKSWKTLISLVAASAMLLTSAPTYASAQQSFPRQGEKAAGELVNIASLCKITAPDAQAGHPASYLTDGDSSTLWIKDGGGWPCQLEFQLPAANTKLVKKVELKFESGHTPWGVDVDLSYALNNVTSDLIAVPGAAQTVGFDDGYTFTFEAGQAMSHLYVTLNNPTNNGNPGAFWPALAEVEIYVDQDSEEEVDLVNIASTLNPSVTLADEVNASSDKSNLLDGDADTATLLHTGALESKEPFVQLDFGIDQKMREFVLSLPEADEDLQYRYTLLGRKRRESSYENIFEGTIGTSAPNRTQHIRLAEVSDTKEEEYSCVKVIFRAANDAAKTCALSLAEFQVWANSATIAETDTDNIAWNRRNLHSNYSQDTLDRIVDGNRQNTWSAAQYPAYVDIDLEDLYDLSEIQVFTPAAGYSQYTLYVSSDGQNFNRVARKTSAQSCPSEGESYRLEGVQGSIIRILLEYNSESEKAVLNEIRVLGEKIGPSSQASFTPPEDFGDSAYDVSVTAEDTIQEVQGIVSRNLGDAYTDWFTFSLGEEGEYDYFRLEDGANGRIHITGNDGVSLATGLNHYLKYYCQVSITQVGSQVVMPSSIVPVGEAVYKECKVPVRYAYNYCTMSYSMPFWGEDEWRRELDWLALNGVNLVLDITGQEEVWREFLNTLGYDHAAIKDFIAGPAYYAWAYMANLSGYGGPVHDTWFAQRTELARKNHLTMKKLGMQPVLQGYSGMVPNNLTDYASGDYAITDSDIIRQGTWCSYQRPDMLATTSKAYETYAALFYRCQANVYGTDAHYYATDPFHEGGNTGSLDVADVSDSIMKSMLSFDPKAVWVIQAWQGNPTPRLLQGLHKDGGTDYRSHALVLDLYAEKSPWWNNSYYPVSEFNQTPWAFCMLNNFGGRMGLHGHMDNLVSGVVEAANTADCLTGIGITPEGSQNNPVLYDLLFETVWCNDASKELVEIDTSQWLSDYVTRRYGAESENAYEAMRILENTVYKASLNMLGQGAPESYINARPSTSISAASTWGNAVISYDMEELEEAAELLLEDYDLLKDSDGYQYDLADILKQVLSNSSQKYHRAMVSALNAGDLEAFTQAADQFLGLIDEVEKVLSTRKEFLLGTWVEQAKALAEQADDFSMDLYEFNAKSLVTTWGAYPQAISGGLKDYSNRQWAGLTKDFYKVRWQTWIDYQKAVLAGEEATSINWFSFEWEWARSKTVYTTKPSGLDLESLGWEILEKYSSVNDDPASDDSFDYPVSKMTASSPNYEDADGNRPQEVLDADPSTLWHTVWGASQRVDHYIVLELEEEAELTGLRYLPRSSGVNGLITKYEVYVSATGREDDYTLAASGNWENSSEWKLAAFTQTVRAKYVKLVSVESLSEETGHYYSSAAELRVTTPNRVYQPAESVRISPRSLTLNPGEIGQLTAKVRPSGADTNVIWSSSDPAIAAVDAAGKVTALSSGTAVVTATAAGDSSVSGSALVTILPDEEEPEKEITEAKEALQKLLDADGNLSGEDYTKDSWQAYLEALNSVGKVLNNPKASLQEISDAKAAYETAKAGLMKKKPQEEPQPPKQDTPTPSTPAAGIKVAKISLKADTKNLAAGKKTVVSAAVSPVHSADKSLIWTSSNPNYASVNAKGVVTAKKAGAGKRVTITATAADGSGAHGSIKLRIYRNAVKKITIKAPAATVKAGKTLKLKSSVTPVKKSYRKLRWISGNTRYATVNSKGVVKAKKAGKGKRVKITAQAMDGSKRKASIKIRIK